MNRRTLLRYAGTGLTTGFVVGIAGCSDDSSGGDGDDENEAGEDESDGSNGTDEGSDGSDDQMDGSDGEMGSQGESAGSVAENTVEGLEVVGMESEIADGRFQVTVTVENAGEQTTTIFDYNYELVPYDANGNELQTTSSGTTAFGSEAAPGESAEIIVSAGVDAGPEQVDSYEITVNCQGMFGTEDGVYCQDEASQ